MLALCRRGSASCMGAASAGVLHGTGQACHELMSSAACGASRRRSSCIAHDPATLPPKARRLEVLVKLER